VAAAVGLVFRLSPFTTITGALVAPLKVPSADVGLTFRVKPVTVGVGEAATVPIKACSRSFTLDATRGAEELLASASMRWPLPMCVASKIGALVMLNLSKRVLNMVLELTPTSTVTGEADVPVE